MSRLLWVGSFEAEIWHEPGPGGILRELSKGASSSTPHCTSVKCLVDGTWGILEGTWVLLVVAG